MANVNRLVWSNGFTNDRRAHQNKEPYKKTCNKCGNGIWVTPTKTGWTVVGMNGAKHECKVKKNKVKRKEGKAKAYEKKCKFCERLVRMKMIAGKWRVLELDGKRHRCDRRSDEEILDTDLLKSSPIERG